MGEMKDSSSISNLQCTMCNDVKSARKMKDSGIEWIGEIPQEWESVPLKYLVSYNDETLGEDTEEEFEFDYIDISSVEYGKGITNLQSMKFKNAPSRARRIVRKDDVILSTVRTYLRSVATIKEFEKQQIASTGFIVLRANVKRTEPNFLNYAVLSNAFISMVESKSVGISYPAINSSEVVTIKIPVSPLAEQQKISSYLDEKCREIDSVVTKTKATIEEYKKLKQSIITEAVTKGIRPDRPMKDSGIEWIGEIPQEWKIIPHKYIMHKEKTICNYYNGEDIISLTMRGVIIRDLSAGGKMPETFDGYQYVEPEDLLLCLFDIDVTPRCVGLVKNFGITSPAYSRFKIHDGYFNSYYDYLLRMVDDTKAFVHLSKNLRNSLTETDFGAILTIAPPFDEQQEIANYLDEKCTAIDTLIEKKQQLLTEMESYKKSLIYECVTGKREI